MPGVVAPDDVVRRIAAERTFVNERGGVGIRLKPAAAIVRQYGQQFRPTAASATAGGSEIAASALNGQWCFRVSF